MNKICELNFIILALLVFEQNDAEQRNINFMHGFSIMAQLTVIEEPRAWEAMDGPK